MADKWYTRSYTDLGLLVTRALPSFMLLWFHGIDKIAKLGDSSLQFADPFGLGPTISLGMVVFAEVVCAAAVGLGVCARLASIPIIIQFVVIYFMIKGDKPYMMKEEDILYALPFVLVFLAGPGKYAIDTWLFKAKRAY